jgi:hypothetical protein
VSKPFRPAKNVISSAVFSPIVGHVQLGYERHLNHRRSVVVKFGLMNVTALPARHVQGLTGQYLRLGYKFVLLPRQASLGIQGIPRSPLEGLYLRPELLLAHSRYPDYFYQKVYKDGSLSYVETTYTARSVAVGSALNVGYQAIFWRRLSIDFSVGMGIGFAIDDGQNQGTEPYYYGFWMIENRLALASNLAFGFAF